MGELGTIRGIKFDVREKDVNGMKMDVVYIGELPVFAIRDSRSEEGTKVYQPIYVERRGVRLAVPEVPEVMAKDGKPKFDEAAGVAALAFRDAGRELPEDAKPMGPDPKEG